MEGGNNLFKEICEADIGSLPHIGWNTLQQYLNPSLFNLKGVWISACGYTTIVFIKQMKFNDIICISTFFKSVVLLFCLVWLHSRKRLGSLSFQVNTTAKTKTCSKTPLKAFEWGSGVLIENLNNIHALLNTYLLLTLKR